MWSEVKLACYLTSMINAMYLYVYMYVQYTAALFIAFQFEMYIHSTQQVHVRKRIAA